MAMGSGAWPAEAARRGALADGIPEIPSMVRGGKGGRKEVSCDVVRKWVSARRPEEASGTRRGSGAGGAFRRARPELRLGRSQPRMSESEDMLVAPIWIPM